MSVTFKSIVHRFFQHLTFLFGYPISRHSEYFKLAGGRAEPIDNASAFQGFVTWNDTSLLYESRFDNAYPVTSQLESHYSRDFTRYRAHVSSVLANSSARLEGDMLFIGVAYGVVPRTILKFVDHDIIKNKTLFLVDAWEGLWSYSDKEKVREVTYPESLDEVKPLFEGSKNVRFLKGIAPGILGKLENGEKYCHVHLNTGDPHVEIECMKKIWPSVTSGGTVEIGNYAFVKGYREVFDGYLTEIGVYPLLFPSGQAVVIKH